MINLIQVIGDPHVWQNFPTFTSFLIADLWKVELEFDSDKAYFSMDLQ